MKKWIWITGCASGLGKHLTTQLLLKGHSVLATDINIDALQQVFSQEHWPEDRAEISQLDITQLSQWQALYQSSVEQGKQFSHLLNVAGFIEPGHICQNMSKQIGKHIHINLMGMVNGCETILAHFEENKQGHIINISSMAGIVAVPGVVSYSIAKAATRSFSNGLAMELQLDGSPIKVSSVCPDLIATPMMEKQLDYGDQSQFVFSGSVLSVETVGALILGKVWHKKPIEVAIPFKREWQTRLSSLFPNQMVAVYRRLAEKGRQQLEKNRQK